MPSAGAGSRAAAGFQQHREGQPRRRVHANTCWWEGHSSQGLTPSFPAPAIHLHTSLQMAGHLSCLMCHQSSLQSFSNHNQCRCRPPVAQARAAGMACSCHRMLMGRPLQPSSKSGLSCPVPALYLPTRQQMAGHARLFMPAHAGGKAIPATSELGPFLSHPYTSL